MGVTFRYEGDLHERYLGLYRVYFFAMFQLSKLCFSILREKERQEKEQEAKETRRAYLRSLSEERLKDLNDWAAENVG